MLCRGGSIKPIRDVYCTETATITFSTMSNVDWDSKVVIGSKAKAPKVTRNAKDLNGSFYLEYNFIAHSLPIFLFSQPYVSFSFILLFIMSSHLTMAIRLFDKMRSSQQRRRWLVDRIRLVKVGTLQSCSFIVLFSLL